MLFARCFHRLFGTGPSVVGEERRAASDQSNFVSVVMDEPVSQTPNACSEVGSNVGSRPEQQQLSTPDVNAVTVDDTLPNAAVVEVNVPPTSTRRGDEHSHRTVGHANARDRNFEVSMKPYANSHEYLHAELDRIALLLKAYVTRRQGAACANMTSVEAVLQKPFQWRSFPLSPDASQRWQEQLDEVREMERCIEARLRETPPELRRRFPLRRLLGLLQQAAQRTATSSNDQRNHEVRLQRDILLLCLLEYRFADQRGAIHELTTDDGTQPGCLSVGMAAEICQQGATTTIDPLAIFSETVPLLRERIVVQGELGVEASRRRLQIDVAIAGFLLESGAGDPELEDHVRLLTTPVQWTDVVLAEPVLAQFQQLAHRLTHRSAEPFVLLHGPLGGPFDSVVRATMTELRRPLLMVVDVTSKMGTEGFVGWVRRVYRQAQLLGAAVLWMGVTPLIEADKTDARWRQLLKAPGQLIVFAAAERVWDPSESEPQPTPRTFLRMELPVPDAALRRRLWIDQLQEAGLELAEPARDVALDLLTSYQFTQGQIADAIRLTLGSLLTDTDSTPVVAQHLYDAVRRVSARGLVSFTQRVPPRKPTGAGDPLDAVVLGGEARQLLHELDARIKHLDEVHYGYGFGERLGLGRGLIALFSGPSGTGKTFAATVLAGSNQRDLYKVDMSAVVSKYVGETEKNLARVFGDAQSSNALLFFDEADAIFGKRGEVDKAQDRWANMEVNYLLQRVEEFSGVVILATNLKQNMDEAFLRRVQVLIDFKAPDAASRARILSAMFPAGVIQPSSEDIKEFSQQFDLTGGNLKNIAVDAAFRALPTTPSHEPLEIRIEHLVVATAREYRKLSRPVSLASFGRRFFDMVKALFQFD